MHPLKQFYDNVNMREMVKEYLIAQLKEIATTKAFNGENTAGMREAKEAIDMAFSNLKGEYGEIAKPVISSSR